MERFVGKVAIVTGASSGIGAAIAEDLAKAGLVVAGIARRVDKVQAIADKLTGDNCTGKLHAVKADVTDESELLAALAWVKVNLGPIHVLVNNAGVHRPDSLSDGATDAWRTILDTNVVALCIATREAVRDMNENKVDGHIVHINSITGHAVPVGMSGLYAGSKFAITALTETLRQELLTAKSKIKISSVSPGVVESEMSSSLIARFGDKLPYLNAEDISNAVLYVIGTPPHVQIHEIIVKPVGEST